MAHLHEELTSFHHRCRSPWARRTVVGERERSATIDVTHILHELLADRSDFFVERGAEHQHLLFVRGHLEDFLHISTHI